MKWLLIVLLYLMPVVAVHADSGMPPAALANTQLPDPKQESEARALMEAIRCLVCEGQSVADSNAELAGDMRALIRSRVAAGEHADVIKAWLIERYGTGITYAPPFGWETAVLWLAPLILILLGAVLARGRIRLGGR
jgi:cytochrome c-type biogenesis protein CcmH